VHRDWRRDWRWPISHVGARPKLGTPHPNDPPCHASSKGTLPSWVGDGECHHSVRNGGVSGRPHRESVRPGPLVRSTRSVPRRLESGRPQPRRPEPGRLAAGHREAATSSWTAAAAATLAPADVKPASSAAAVWLLSSVASIVEAAGVPDTKPTAAARFKAATFCRPASRQAPMASSWSLRRSSAVFSSTLAFRDRADAAAASAQVRVATAQVCTINFSCSSEIGEMTLRPSLCANERCMVLNNAVQGVQRGEGEPGRHSAAFVVRLRLTGEGVRTWAAPVCSGRSGLSNRAARERNAEDMVPPGVRAVRFQRELRAADSLVFTQSDARQSTTQPKIRRPSTRIWATDIRALRPNTWHLTIPIGCLTCKRSRAITQAVTLGLVSA